jgi:hypothetical protein
MSKAGSTESVFFCILSLAFCDVRGGRGHNPAAFGLMKHVENYRLLLRVGIINSNPTRRATLNKQTYTTLSNYSLKVR